MKEQKTIRSQAGEKLQKNKQREDKTKRQQKLNVSQISVRLLSLYFIVNILEKLN